MSDENVGIFCTQETWLQNKIVQKLYPYKIIRKDRSSGNGGGVMIGIHKNIHFVPLRKHSMDSMNEVIGCNISIKGKKKLYM